MQDDELLRRAKAGDRDAVANLVASHQRVVRAYLSRIAPDPATADDLAQEVFLQFFQALERTDETRSVRPYLLGIARNLARMNWRKMGIRREVAGEAFFEALEARAQHETSAEHDSDRRERLRKCMEALSPKARDVILLFYRDELRCEDVAERMKMPSGSIRSILTRGREALRDCMDRGMSGSGAEGLAT